MKDILGHPYITPSLSVYQVTIKHIVCGSRDDEYDPNVDRDGDNDLGEV